MAAVRFEQIEQTGICAMDIVVNGATVSGLKLQYQILVLSEISCGSYDCPDQAQLFTNVCVIACDLCAQALLTGLFT